jgi:hypothetical protein
MGVLVLEMCCRVTGIKLLFVVEEIVHRSRMVVVADAGGREVLPPPRKRKTLMLTGITG